MSTNVTSIPHAEDIKIGEKPEQECEYSYKESSASHQKLVDELPKTVQVVVDNYLKQSIASSRVVSIECTHLSQLSSKP